jgi:hypothetical protein
MADSVLYFPTIRPPENEWFCRVLLYWERVGTILPKHYAEDHAFLRPYTSALINEALLTPIAPDDSVWKSGAVDYSKAFLDLVDSDPFGVEQTPADQRPRARLHLDKTGMGLALALANRGLANLPEGPENFTWVEVEQHTADLLMAFLASIVGKDEQVAMDPITDSDAAIAAFTTLPEEDRAIATELEPIRYALLSEVLPGPAAGIEPARLAEFRAEHLELLTGFRNRVEREARQCAQATDPRLKQEMVNGARTDLAAEIEEIERRMCERTWPLAERAALGVAAGALGLLDIAVSGGTLLGLASTSLGLAGAVDAAFQGKRTQDVLGNPLAYAALARRELPSAAS